MPNCGVLTQTVRQNEIQFTITVYNSSHLTENTVQPHYKDQLLFIVRNAPNKQAHVLNLEKKIRLEELAVDGRIP